DVTYVMYAGGKSGFTAPGIARVSLVVLGYAPGIWAYSINHVFTRAFYALGDTATPMRVSIWMVFLNLALNVVLIWFFREAGLAWSTTIAASVQSGVLLLLLRRRVRTMQETSPSGAAAGAVTGTPAEARPVTAESSGSLAGAPSVAAGASSLYILD